MLNNSNMPFDLKSVQMYFGNIKVIRDILHKVLDIFYIASGLFFLFVFDIFTN